MVALNVSLVMKSLKMPYLSNLAKYHPIDPILGMSALKVVSGKVDFIEINLGQIMAVQARPIPNLKNTLVKNDIIIVPKKID